MYQFGSFNQYFAEGTRAEYLCDDQVSLLEEEVGNPQAVYACINAGQAAAPLHLHQLRYWGCS